MFEPIAYFTWDPSPALFPFKIPFLNRPLLWYGFLFALGFFVGYLVLISLLRRFFSSRPEAKKMAEELTFYVIIGAVVGSRLGDLLFIKIGPISCGILFRSLLFGKGGLLLTVGQSGF